MHYELYFFNLTETQNYMQHKLLLPLSIEHELCFRTVPTKIFGLGLDHMEKLDLCKGYWNSKKNRGSTTHWKRSQCVAISVGKASHQYGGGHRFESPWSPDFFFRLLSNCLNWKINCDDHSSLSLTSFYWRFFTVKHDFVAGQYKILLVLCLLLQFTI